MSSYIFDGGNSLYRVTLHNTYKRDNHTGRAIVRYSLRRLSDNTIIFNGSDLGVPQSIRPASKESAYSLLTFLTVAPGDTDSEHTPLQLAWCMSSDAQALSSIVYDHENERE